ncbi:MAG: PD-(D/E)XK nuclease family protein, partial [Planctomycetota bacterium]
MRFARADAQGLGRACDLQSVLCVLPGNRAGRLLLAQLAEKCEARGIPLIPPDIRTPGGMVDALVTLDSRPSASAPEQSLAWMRALRTADPETIAPLVPQRPDDQNVLDWFHLAGTVARIAEELAGERMTPESVAVRAESLELFGEADRWRALESVHALYRAQLADAGLIDPHEARWNALERGAGNTDRHLVLVGVVELNAMQRAAAEAWGDRADALVHAPESLEDRFDELGCLQSDAWAEIRIDIDEQRIVVADRPTDQAQAVLRSLADFGGNYAPEVITVGLGDEEMQDLMARAGRSANVSLHWAAGRALAHTGPYRLLAAAGTWLADGRLSDLGALLRHPHLEAWLGRKLPDLAGDEGEHLGLLDAYVGDHLQDDHRSGWLGEPQRRERLNAIHGAVEEIWSRLRGDDEQTLGEWAGRIVETLHDVYATIGQEPDQGDDALLADACSAINDVCTECARIASALQLKIDAPTAIAIVLARAENERLPLEPRRGDIEMLGWLELHLDLAEAVVVAGFNDGHIPQTVTGHAFLPDALRRSLGLISNARRYARDAYVLEALRHSCRELRIVAGHRSAEGEALAPSRLLLMPQREHLPARVLRLCGESGTTSIPWPMGAPAAATKTSFTVPALPDDLDSPARMSVTEFKNYLACPYRYALSRLLRLRPVRHDIVEMDALTFGGLAHNVLHAFASDQEIAGSTDPQRIADFLEDKLQALCVERFGGDPLPAIRVQIARLAQRLRSFAMFQARHRQDGWIIHETEIAYDDTSLEVPGQDPMPIRGRIDRIDRHEGTGAWMIADYKTSESGETPHMAHHGRNTLPTNGNLEWLDLQLPLYQYLAGRHDVGGDVT